MREGWTYKKLGEIGDIITGSTPSTQQKDNYNSNDVCFVKPSDIPKEGIGLLSNSEFYISNKAYNNSRKLPIGSVLTTCIGIIGKVGILNVNATCNQQINAIIPYSNISSTFLAYSILAKRHYLEHIANAPVVPIINKKEFSNTIIPVPPLSEQECIVSELDLLSSIIEKKKAQLKEYDKLAQSIFYDMFGDPVTNEKGWEVKKLGELCNSELGKTLNQSKDTGTLRPYLCAINIQWNKIIKDDLKKTRFEDAELERYSVKKGDLLICEGGDIGRAAIWNENDEIQYQNALHRLRFGKKMIPIFCLYDLKYLKDKGILDNRYGKGVTIKHLVKSALLSIPFIVPPLSLQQSFASKIEAIERQKALVQQSIVETQTMFDYTMDKYFG